MAFWGLNGLFRGLVKVQKLFGGEYNTTLCPPTDQLKLGLAQLSLSVWAECGKKYANMSIKRIVLIRLIDLQALKSFARNRIRRKMQITEMAIFTLYFRGDCFIIFNDFVVVLPLFKKS